MRKETQRRAGGLGFSALGKHPSANGEVWRFAITTTRAQVIWDTRGVDPGTYTVALYNNGDLLQAEKLILRP